jgi:hypothetical protein
MLKHILFNMMGFIFSDPLNLKIILDGKQLENGSTVGDYNIHAETFLTVVLGLRGGMDDSDGDAMQDISQQMPEHVPPSPPRIAFIACNMKASSFQSFQSGPPRVAPIIIAFIAFMLKAISFQ